VRNGNVKNDSWLNHAEAAAYIKKTSAALYKLTSNREIRYRKRGKSNIYKLDDLNAYLEEGVVETSTEVIRDLKFSPKRKYSLTKK